MYVCIYIYIQCHYCIIIVGFCTPLAMLSEQTKWSCLKIGRPKILWSSCSLLKLQFGDVRTPSQLYITLVNMYSHNGL